MKNLQLLRRELIWKPTVSLEEGINEMINWVNDNWSEIKKSVKFNVLYSTYS